MQRLSILLFANGQKRSMGHFLGAEKGNFLIRGRGRPTVYGGRAGLILSIPAGEVSLGSSRVCSRRAQSPTPHTPPLPAYFGQTRELSSKILFPPSERAHNNEQARAYSPDVKP